MKQDCYIFAVPDPSKNDGFRLELVPENLIWYMADEDIKLELISIPFKTSEEIDLDSLRVKAINTLKDKQTKIMADAQFERNKLQEKINSLLLLGHSGD